MELRTEDYTAIIEECAGRFSLYWTDYVANEWIETFKYMSQAIARLAILQACQESDWVNGFASNPEKFSHDFNEFAAKVTS